MSGHKLSTKQRLAGKIGAAAVIAAMAGAPQELLQALVGGVDSSGYALAGKSPPPPPPPPPPPAAPAAAPLNLDPNVHWFASWTDRTNPPAQDFIVSPHNIDPGGIFNAQTQYNASVAAAPTRPLGLVVESPALTTAQASSLFSTSYGGKAISYVFSDMESGTDAQVLTNVTNLVNQVRTSTWSKNAYVGHADLTPLNDSDDRTYRNQAPGMDASAHRHFGKSQYDSSKVNMANTALYPGNYSTRNKSTADWSNNNIRTALFVAPIWRMSQVQNVLDSSYNGSDTLGIGLTKHKQIPWITRFNNSGNNSLDTDQNPATGYAFVPGAPLNNGYVNLTSAQTANQMVGRGDFSGQVLHYRMRGAYSINLFAPVGPNGGGAVGYSATDAQSDVRYGWYGQNYGGNTDNALGVAAVNHMNNIFAASDNKRATMTMNPIVDGTSDSGGKRAEVTGTLWSGVYSLSQKKLDILASNLDKGTITPADHMIKFGTVDVYDVFIASSTGNSSGYTYADPMNTSPSRNFLIQEGMHKLLQFDLVTTRVYNSSTYTGSYKTQTIWLLNANYQVFTNNNRNDVGVPEPTTFGVFAAAGSMAVVCRRHRRNKNQTANA